MPDPAPLLIGLDLGTTHIKAQAFTAAGEAVGSARHPTPMTHPRPGWGEMDPEALWDACCALLRTLAVKTAARGTVAAIAVTSVGEAGVPLDAQGIPTYASMAWYDTRPQPQVDELARRLGAEAIFAASGQALHPIFGVCKLLWLQANEPDAFRRTCRWLTLSDFVAWRLSGVMGMEYSLASRTMALDVHRRRWADAFLQEIGLSAALWPDLRPSGQVLGRVRPEVSRRLGWPAAVQVATGGHDHVVAALALGVTAPGTLLDSLGGAEGLFLPLDEPLAAAQLGAYGYSQGIHVTGGHYLMAGLYTSGVAVDWFRDQFAPQDSYAALTAAARAAPAGSRGALFLPHLRLAHPGYPAASSRGAYVGLSFDTDKGALFRATLEGVALEARYSLEQALALGSIPEPARIVLTGGGTRNPLLMRIKAAVMRRELRIAHRDDAATLGAALLAGVGIGLYGSCAEAAAAVPVGADVVAPDPAEAACYARLYADAYVRLYRDLQPLHQALIRLHVRAPASGERRADGAA